MDLLDAARLRQQSEFTAEMQKLTEEQSVGRRATANFRQQLVESGALRLATKPEYDEWLSRYWTSQRENIVYFDHAWTGRSTGEPIYIATRNIDLEMVMSYLGDVRVIVPRGVKVMGPRGTPAGGLGSVVLLDVESGTATESNGRYTSRGAPAIGVWTDTKLEAQVIATPETQEVQL
jgi:hypothetical protein